VHTFEISRVNERNGDFSTVDCSRIRCGASRKIQALTKTEDRQGKINPRIVTAILIKYDQISVFAWPYRVGRCLCRNGSL
jgi:hypothetical protein